MNWMRWIVELFYLMMNIEMDVFVFSTYSFLWLCTHCTQILSNGVCLDFCVQIIGSRLFGFNIYFLSMVRKYIYIEMFDYDFHLNLLWLYVVWTFVIYVARYYSTRRVLFWYIYLFIYVKYKYVILVSFLMSWILSLGLDIPIWIADLCWATEDIVPSPQVVSGKKSISIFGAPSVHIAVYELTCSCTFSPLTNTDLIEGIHCNCVLIFDVAFKK